MLKEASESGTLNEDLHKQLEALGYMGGYETATVESGVSVLKADKLAEGLNLVVSAHGPEVYLMRSDGEVVHRWNCPRNKAFPDLARTKSDKKARSFRRAYVLPDRSLVGIYNGTGMVKLSSESEIIWTQPAMCHHDLCFSPDYKQIYTIIQKRRLFPAINKDEEVMDEEITVLNAENGESLRQFSLLEAFHGSEYSPMLRKAPSSGDVLHANTVRYVTEAQAAKVPVCQVGDILFSVRNMDTIGFLDMETGRVRWALTGLWAVQHEPTILENGNILVFDNSGNKGKSRVIEINPLTHEVVWKYTGEEGQPLNSETSGSCSRLPNGNTLITESNRGRAIEVTPDKEIVWEYQNPGRWGPRKDLRATLFDVQRIPEEYFNSVLS